MIAHQAFILIEQTLLRTPVAPSSQTVTTTTSCVTINIFSYAAFSEAIHSDCRTRDIYPQVPPVTIPHSTVNRGGSCVMILRKLGKCRKEFLICLRNVYNIEAQVFGVDLWIVHFTSGDCLEMGRRNYLHHFSIVQGTKGVFTPLTLANFVHVT
jgi:hypothetical protein